MLLLPHLPALLPERFALKNTGIVLPPMRITVNLSPAGMRKEGTAFDLPIAVGILKALGHLPGDSTEGMLVIGELGLSGRVNPVRGVLPLVKKAGLLRKLPFKVQVIALKYIIISNIFQYPFFNSFCILIRVRQPVRIFHHIHVKPRRS